MIKNLKLLSIFLLNLPFCGFSALDATMEVSAEVIPACDVTVNDLNFGIYNQSILEQITSISILCTKGSYYSIGIDSGTSNGGTIASRIMQRYNDKLKYSIYQDPSMNKLWGNSSNNSLTGIGTGNVEHIQVYAKIFEKQNLPNGMYNDEVLITINIGSSATPQSMSYQLGMQMKVRAQVEH